MQKASKSEVDYSRGHAGAHCGKVLEDDLPAFHSAIVARE
jgi:hypothetical protein